MSPVVKQSLSAVRDLCERHCVKRLELFGSGVRDDFDPAVSDLDFLVKFAPLPPGQHAEAYFTLLQELQDLFGQDVDLVESEAIRNPYFLESVNKQRTLLYAA